MSDQAPLKTVNEIVEVNLHVVPTTLIRQSSVTSLNIDPHLNSHQS